MGVKIKKDSKVVAQSFKRMHVKYTLSVPLLGILDIIAMIMIYTTVANVPGLLFLKGFLIFFGIVGAVFAYWGYTWTVTSDNKRITARALFKPIREVAYADISKVEIHQKKKHPDMVVYYTIYGRNDERIVNVYSNMGNSGTLLERLKNLGIKFEEIADK